MRRLALLVFLVGACDGAPDVSRARGWKPDDHDKAQNGQAMPRGAASGNSDEMLVELTWQESCSPCHGPSGHGDGPNGALVKAPNLTDPEWQAKTTDAQIAQQIKNGKGLMPKFDIPDKTVQGLTARIRAFKGR